MTVASAASRPRPDADVRIALVGASHWHVPLYLEPLARPGRKVVAVSDEDAALAARVAARYGCPAHATWEEALARGDVDVVLVFGRHAELTRIGAACIARGIPFVIEKPCGISAADVASLRRQADDAGVYAAVPCIFRMCDLLKHVEATEGGLPARFHHLGFRFIVGPPQRYIDAGSPWMLDRGVAGGGSTINVGTHFIDLFHVLTGSPIRQVAAMATNRGHGGSVEDHATLVVRAEDGTTGVIETGYTYPSSRDDQREFSFTMSSDRRYYRSAADGLIERSRGATPRSVAVPVRLDTDVYYPEFLDRVLADLRSGAAPLAGLADAEAMMRVVDAAYASAARGGEPVAC